jgi:hypothetical protein
MALILNKAKALKNNAVNDNLIINGNFEIWQRGLEFITTGYSADRWFLSENGSIKAYRKLSNNLENSVYCLRIETLPQELSTNTSSFVVAQAIETSKVIPLRNKYVSLSFYIRCPSSNNWSGNLVATAKSSSSTNNILNRAAISESIITIIPTEDNSWVKYSSSFILPSDCSTLSIEFTPSNNLSAGSIIDIAQVKLEAGDFTTYLKTRPQEEYFESQRFYQILTAKLRAGTGAGSTQKRRFGNSINLLQQITLNNPSISIIEDRSIGLLNPVYQLANSNKTLDISAESNSPHSEIDVGIIIDSELKFGQAPPTPSGISIVRASSGITISWLSISSYINESINYSINYGISPESLTGIITTSGISEFVANIGESTPFYASVSSNSFFGSSKSSEVITSAPTFSIPSGVSGLSASWKYNLFDLSWNPIINDGGSPLQKYIVQVNNSSGFTNQPDYGINSNGYTITENATNTSTSISRLYTMETSGSGPYYIRVAGFNRAGTGVWSSTLTLNKTTPLSIRNVSTLAINSGITLSYLPPSGNGGSDITITQAQYSSSIDFSAAITKNYSPNFEPITISGLTNAVGKWFRMRAINPIGTGDWSNYVSGVPNRTLTVPNNPTGLNASWIDTSGIGLTFLAPTDDGGSPIINYTVNIATNSGFTTNSRTYNTLNNNPSIEIPTPIYTGIYYLRSKANNSLGSSNYSSGISINSTSPAAPVLLFASPVNSGAALSWTAPIGRGSSVTSYNIDRSSSSSFSSPTTITGITGVLTYTVNNLTNNSSLYFRVLAVNTSGTGLVSNYLIATPKSPYTTPSEPINSLLTRYSSPTGVRLSWSSPINNGGLSILSYNYQFSTGISFSSFLSSGTVSSSTFQYSLDTQTSSIIYGRVRATNSEGNGAWSATATAPVLLTSPTVPLNFSGVPGSGSFSLSWQAPSSSGNDSTPLIYNISSDKLLDDNTLLLGPSFTTTNLTGLLTVDSSGSSGPGRYQICIRSQNSLYYSNSSCITLTNSNLASKPTSYNIYYTAHQGNGTLLTSTRPIEDFGLISTAGEDRIFQYGEWVLSAASTAYGIAIYKASLPSYLRIDFGAQVYVSALYFVFKKFGIAAGAAYSANKTIQSSSDNITWTTIGNTGGQISTSAMKVVLNKQCRYIRILNPTNNSWMSFSKLYFT